MKSPFPGMDPYLEQHWLEIHFPLIIYAMDQLQEQLPREMRARMAQRVFVEPEDLDENRRYYPAVRVVESRTELENASGESATGVALAEPVLLPLLIPKIRQSYIEVVDCAMDNRVITVIEFLSPTNKVPGEGQDQFLQKQREMLKSKSNNVEIDLTRRGHRRLMLTASLIPRQYRATFQACVRRVANSGNAELYPIPLQTMLPKITIPLRKKDKDVTLDLQALIEQCYKNGRYDDIDYSVPPNPPLEAADAKWATALLRKHRRK